MPRLPQKNRDLRRLALRRDLFRLLGWLLWIAVWLGGAASYNANHQTYPDHRRLVGWRLLLLLLIAAGVGFLLFRCWKLFFDRSVSGVIRSTRISRSAAPLSDGASSDEEVRINLVLKLVDDNQKTHRMRFEQKNGFYHYYGEGERIVRFHGLPYPTNTNPDAVHGCVCSLCGAHAPELRAYCEVCGLSIVDPKLLREEQASGDAEAPTPEKE